jgi:hypothetical protein
MHRAFVRKAVAISRVALPFSVKRRLSRKVSRAASAVSVGTIAGVVADAVVKHNAPSLFDVDQDVKENLLASL